MKQFQTLSEINSDFTVCIVMESLIAYSLIKKSLPLVTGFSLQRIRSFILLFFFFLFLCQVLIVFES